MFSNHHQPLSPAERGFKRWALSFFGCRNLLVLIAAVLAFAACEPAATPTPAPTASPVVRSTLPPTWTPTPTYTPLPPLPTATLAPTATLTPTLSAAALCEAFVVDTNIDQNHRLHWDMHITLLVQSPAGVTIRFLAVHRQTDGSRSMDLPGGMAGFQLPVSQLPAPGLYDWTVKLHSDAYGDICQREGWFVAVAPESRWEREIEIQ